MGNIKEKAQPAKHSLELSFAGFFMLLAAAWELLFSRVFSYMGYYSAPGGVVRWTWLAYSGVIAMICAGTMALVLSVPMGTRLVKAGRLPGIWWRAVLFLISPTYLLVIFWSIFSSNLSPWLLLGGYLSCIVSAFFLSVLAAAQKTDPMKRRVVLALGLMMLLQAFGWTVLDFIGVDRFGDMGTVATRASFLAEAFMVVTPVVAFFAFVTDSPYKLGLFLRRPHVPALALAIVVTALATYMAVSVGNNRLNLIQVAYLMFGMTVEFPGGYPVYLVSVFFGALAVGSLLFSFGPWRADPYSKRMGMGLALIFMAGLQPYRVYQFAMVLLGFLLMARSMAGKRAEHFDEDEESMLALMEDLDRENNDKRGEP